MGYQEKGRQRDTGRKLPFNLMNERALLGCILLKNEAFFDVVEHVHKADFYEPAHGELFTLVRDMIESGRTAIPSTVMHDYSQDADIGGVLASEYLKRLYDEAPDPSIAFNLARSITDLSLKRKLIRAYEAAIGEALDAPVSLTGAELRSRHDAVFEGLFASTAEAGIHRIGEVEGRVLKRVSEAMQASTTVGLSTGLASTDALLGMLMPGRVYRVVGAPGSGKSKLAQQISEHVAGPGGGFKNVLFFTLEMADEELAERGLSSASGVSADAIERAQVDDEDFYALEEASQKRQDLNLWLDGSSSISVQQIRSKAIRQKRLKGLDLLVIDHELKLKRDEKKGEFDGIRDNAAGLKAIAKDLKIPVIVLTQFKKEFIEAKPIRRPNKGDIYGGSAPEQESDVILMIHREEYMLRAQQPDKDMKEFADWEGRLLLVEGKAEFILGKRRGGQGHGIRQVWFDGAGQGFLDNEPPRKRNAAVNQEAFDL